MPVLFLSASCSGDFRRRAFLLGGAEFLAKPFQIEELPAYLRAILGDGAIADRPAPAGRVVSVIGPDRAPGSAAAAVRLAETCLYTPSRAPEARLTPGIRPLPGKKRGPRRVS